VLTAEIKINENPVALIEARNVETISDKLGDFIGERATVCEYKCTVTQPSNKTWEFDKREFTVIHDRRFGWEGLVNKITEAAMPTAVETISVREE